MTSQTDDVYEVDSTMLIEFAQSWRQLGDAITEQIVEVL